MIWQLNHQALRATALAAAILVSPAASAIEETTTELAEKLGAVESLTNFGEDLKSVMTADLGFTKAQIGRWHDAVDAAFSADLLEADFLEALERGTSAEAREAALAYERSDLALEVRQHVEAAFLQEDPAALIEAGRSYVESASASENALLVDLFAALGGPEQDSLDMDIYFRALAIMAEPIVGAQAAEQWVESAQDLRDGYSKDNFLARVAVYSELPDTRLAEMAEKLNEPLLAGFSGQLVTALSETMYAAVDRLEAEYD